MPAGPLSAPYLPRACTCLAWAAVVGARAGVDERGGYQEHIFSFRDLRPRHPTPPCCPPARPHTHPDSLHSSTSHRNQREKGAATTASLFFLLLHPLLLLHHHTTPLIMSAASAVTGLDEQELAKAAEQLAQGTSSLHHLPILCIHPPIHPLHTTAGAEAEKTLAAAAPAAPAAPAAAGNKKAAPAFKNPLALAVRI